MLCYAMLMIDSEGKLKELVENVFNESKKKRLTIKCKQIECMVISKKINQRVLIFQKY